MNAPYFISLLVLCSLFYGAFTYIQQTSPYTLPSVNSGYLNSITLVQQDSGYVFNMTQKGGYIQPATASSTQNFSASFSLSSSLTVINSASLSSVSKLADASDASVVSYLPYMDVYLNNAIDLDLYLGLWQVTDYCKTFNETTSSLPSSLEPQAEAYIGLGTSPSFSSAYSQSKVNNPTFSIFIGETTAELIFGTDMTKAASETPVATFSPIMGPITASSNTNPTEWTFEVNSLQAGNSTLNLTGVTAAFDININGILMPPATYTDITSYLCSTYCSSCGTTQDERNLTTCEISSPSLLPSLALNINNDEKDQDLSETSDSMSFTNKASITISPEGYTFSETIDGQNYTVFNFISETSNGGYLIIGSQAMSLFYTVFSSSSESNEYGLTSVSYYNITLYQAGQVSENTDDSDDNGAIFQAYSIAAALANSDSETEDSESSDISDSDGSLFVSLSNVQNLTAAVQQNYQKVVQLQQMVTRAGQATSTSSGFVSILSDINKGINVVEPFLDTLGIFTGLGPVTSIVGSLLSVFGIGGGSEISAALNQLSQEIATVSEQVSNLAQEIAAAAQDITQMMNVVSDDIVQVYNKISDLQSQQTAYFSTILTDEQADVCFAEMSGYASTILGGMQALQALSNITDSSQIEGFKTNFLDTCAFCPFALEGLLNAFNPQSEEGGCDLISILTAGNATYHRNWQLSIAGTGGYFISLINMGITLVSALESIQTNSSDAWIAVQSSNNASYQQAVQSLQSAVVGCYETYYQDAQWNVLNYTQEYPATATMSEITQLLSLLYPWKGWVVLSLSIVTKQENFDICITLCFDSSDEPINNDFSVINPGQNFTVDLQTNGTIIIQPFDLQNPLGLANNNTKWIWQPAVESCFSNPTGPLVEFCNSLSFISTYTQGGSASGILSGGLFGTNVVNSSGAVYSFSELTDSEMDEARVSTSQNAEETEIAELEGFAAGLLGLSGPELYGDALLFPFGLPPYMGVVSSSSGQVFFWPNA